MCIFSWPKTFCLIQIAVNKTQTFVLENWKTYIHMFDYLIKTALKVFLAHTSLFCIENIQKAAIQTMPILSQQLHCKLFLLQSLQKCSPPVSLPFHHCFLTSTICCLSWGYCTGGFAPHVASHRCAYLCKTLCA